MRGMILIRIAAPFRTKYRIPGSDMTGQVMELVTTGTIKPVIDRTLSLAET